VRQNAQIDRQLAILETVRKPGESFSQHEIARRTGIARETIRDIEHRALAKVRARLAPAGIVRVQAKSADTESVVAFSVPTPLPDLAKDAALPSEIVWMPAGTHAITAGTVDGATFAGKVICDEQAARVIAASLAALKAAGQRTWLDMNHDDGSAVADVRSFSWDATRGIIAHLEWTPRGEQALRNKEFSSFSPTFEAHRQTGRVVGLIEGHALGGIVNAPAFKAMPALIAARFGGATPEKPAPVGQPGNQNMKELLIKILAALSVKHASDATEEQLVELVAKHTNTGAVSAEVSALKSAYETANTAAITAKRASDAKIAELETKMTEQAAQVASVVARATVEKSDIADVLASYIAKDPASLPAIPRNEAARAELSMERALIWARDIAPLVKRDGLHAIMVHAEKNSGDISKVAAKRKIGTVDVLAANALGTLSGSLIVQQSLSLLKAQLPQFSLFATDFSNASAKLNQQIISRVRTIPTVQAYVPATGYVKSDVTATDVPVTIANHKYTQFDYNANELASTGRDLFGEQAEGSIYALGKDVLDTALALFIVANYTNRTIVTQANFNRAAAIAARVALRKRKVQINQDNGFMLANEDYFGALAQDATIVNLAVYQRPELVTEYLLPKIAGFQPFPYVDLPTTNFLTAIFGVKECALLATRLPYDYVDAQLGGAGGYGNVSQITDPSTGLSMMLTQYVNHDAGASRFRLALMSGVAVGDGARAQLIASA
jgi:phage I-like protein